MIISLDIWRACIGPIDNLLVDTVGLIYHIYIYIYIQRQRHTRTLVLSLSQDSTPSIVTVIGTMTGETKVIGNEATGNFWLYTRAKGFDLTHPRSPTSPPIHPRIRLETSNTPIEIAPQKTALVVVDMQNFFVSRSIGRRGECHDAEEKLLKYGIPAARKAGIQVIWLNWGLTEAELEDMSPSMLRVFRFARRHDPGKVTSKETWTDTGMGEPLGELTLSDGKKVNMGRLFMRGEWNAALHSPLEGAYQSSLHTDLPDVKLHKNRVSGVCDSSSELADYLNQRNHIKTLLFTGVNTDQCVFGTLHDASLKGWDTVLLKDGCGTTSPDFASRMSLYNCSTIWGFVSTCEQLFHGVQNMQ